MGGATHAGGGLQIRRTLGPDKDCAYLGVFRGILSIQQMCVDCLRSSPLVTTGIPPKSGRGAVGRWENCCALSFHPIYAPHASWMQKKTSIHFTVRSCTPPPPPGPWPPPLAKIDGKTSRLANGWMDSKGCGGWGGTWAGSPSRRVNAASSSAAFSLMSTVPWWGKGGLGIFTNHEIVGEALRFLLRARGQRRGQTTLAQIHWLGGGEEATGFRPTVRREKGFC